jgi:hypothetical protein
MEKATGAPANPVQELSEAQRKRIDAEIAADKAAGGAADRNFMAAMTMQIQRATYMESIRMRSAA